MTASGRSTASTCTSRTAALVCLLGPSGCGKTTTLRLIAGFMSARRGRDPGRRRGGLVAGAQSCRPSGGNMSMVFQSYALWPHMTVARERRLRPQAARHAREPSISAAGRRDARRDARSRRWPSAIRASSPAASSSAWRSRARSSSSREILLLDEPLSNLDANLREEMRFEIRRLHDEYQYTTIYVTHDQAEAMTMADLIVVMNGGRIEQVGSPEDIYRAAALASSSPASSAAPTSSRAAGARPRHGRGRRAWCCAAAEGELPASGDDRGVDPPPRHVRLADAPFTADDQRCSRGRRSAPDRISAASAIISSRFPAGCSSGRSAPMRARRRRRRADLRLRFRPSTAGRWPS